MRRLLSLLILTLLSITGFTQPYEANIPLLEDERWWGGAVVDGEQMPFGQSAYSIDLLGNTSGNQSQPLLISNMGRYVWCEDPIRFQFRDDELIVSSKTSRIQYGKAASTLKGAYLYACHTFFPPSGTIPNEKMFRKPQYNTWIELMYNQSQAGILEYARGIIANGLPPGVLMIDDNWQEDYGVWDFKAERFPDPKAMIDELHRMGFKVMLWVCPFVSPDSTTYRELRDRRLLVSDDLFQRKPSIIHWWNGASALLDLTNPETRIWFNQQLRELQVKYGVDGFKLDAGDARFYEGVQSYVEDTIPNRHTELFAEIGLGFDMNEYRACWKMGGQPLVQRLRDKGHNWEDLREIIPDSLAQGLMGYAYTCPDMIGGGEYRSFLNTKTIDQELIVRSTQAQALMPMMQFSVAPWRVLDKENLAICRRMTALHTQFANTIVGLARNASTMGEPIIRPLEYEFPRQGYAGVQDQFMLGSNIMVAPVLTQGATERVVHFPPGEWHSDDGSTFTGPAKKNISAPLSRLPYFTKVDD